MAEKITLRLSAAAAAFVAKDTARETRLQAARGDVAVSGRDLVTLLFFLGHDQDPEIRSAATKSLRDLPEPLLLETAESADTHPKILDMLARLHYPKPAIAAKLAAHPQLEEQTRVFLAETEFAEERRNAPQTPETEGDAAAPEGMDEAGEGDGVDEVKDDADAEKLLSKYYLSTKMEIPEKVKMALIGDKEWRALMLKDTNNMVSLSVLKNPRITEPEILAAINSSALTEEMMRVICGNKDWMKSYQIRRAVVLNCKTPLHTSLRLLTTLNDKDLAVLAKSRDVATVLRQQARKFFLNKKDRESGIV